MNIARKMFKLWDKEETIPIKDAWFVIDHTGQCHCFPLLDWTLVEHKKGHIWFRHKDGIFECFHGTFHARYVL